MRFACCQSSPSQKVANALFKPGAPSNQFEKIAKQGLDHSSDQAVASIKDSRMRLLNEENWSLFMWSFIHPIPKHQSQHNCVCGSFETHRTCTSVTCEPNKGQPARGTGAHSAAQTYSASTRIGRKRKEREEENTEQKGKTKEKRPP